MSQSTAMITSASEIAERFLRTAREQAQAAQSKQWEVVYELADFRELLLRRLTTVTAGPLTPRERGELTHAILQVQAFDVEIQQCAEDESRRILDELSSVEQGRTVAHGYGWAAATRQSSLLERYG